MNNLSGFIRIEIGGKVRPIKFGMGAWKYFTEVTGVQLADLANVDAITFGASIVYGGLKQAALADNEPVDFNINNVYDWLDEMPQDDYSKIMTTLLESKVLGNTFKSFIEGQPNNSDSNKKKVKPSQT